MSETKQVKVSLDLEDYEELKQYADSKSITVAELFRRSVGVDFAKKRDVTKKKSDCKGSLSLLYYLSKIEKNIKQIAARCHTKKEVDRHTLFALEKLYKEIWSVEK